MWLLRIVFLLSIIAAVIWHQYFDRMQTPPADDRRTVIVVGGGLAGLSAAIENAKASKNVRIIIIEKEKG